MPDSPYNTPSASPRTNQRRARRQAPKSSTRARASRNTMGLGANLAVAVLDVSETGIRLVLKENLPKGHEFEVTLESVSSRPVKVVAQVIWSQPLADGNFCVGAAFSRNINRADLACLART